ncbi:uncharacterized protein TRIADDRAFT_58114 [Trichoplax adhaerens]|uniref:SH3 domain-containing protein n=1 Tax=Trichoplax adhaerens TaxID=10228 RepID=B3S2Q9_TRIAD|nr:hypothetical protein TRIADDRAFT_58114 [Trichoplax adhaerens]EDV23137.1 hypothetical protein TRIADDRAFT_58114 [Trichoplax adhaerens]|eukprot:XP_002114047.1 hypothetical protein TRIADDRAFT_58114 [Trichoplax adhaerens]
MDLDQVKKKRGAKKRRPTKEESSPLAENEGGSENLRQKTRARFAQLLESSKNTSDNQLNESLSKKRRSPRGASTLSNEDDDDRLQPHVKIPTKDKSLNKNKKKSKSTRKARDNDKEYENDENTPEKVNYADNEGYIHDDNNVSQSIPEGKRTKKKAKFKLSNNENPDADYIDTPKKPDDQGKAKTAKSKSKKDKRKKAKEDPEAKDKKRKKDKSLRIPVEEPILTIAVHKADQLELDVHVKHPLVRIHLVDISNGQYVKKSNRDKSVVSYYENENDAVDYILPVMTQPYDYKKHRSFTPHWEELILYNEAFSCFVKQDQSQTIVFFEILDFLGMNITNTAAAANQNGGWHKIAWAFLKLVGGNGEFNTDKRVRLQLYRCPRTAIHRKNDSAEIYKWWKDCPRVKYPSTLYVTVKSTKPPQNVDPSMRSMFPVQKEESKITYDELSNTIIDEKRLKDLKAEEESKIQWSKLPSQDCRIPNKLLHNFSTGMRGCLVVKFSHNGRKIAAGCVDKQSYPILVYDLKTGKCCNTFTGHFSIIYDVSWSADDEEILTASSDGTARVWNFNESGGASKILPHPTFIYTAKYHPVTSTLLLAELPGHSGYINTIAFSKDGDRMFSGDSVGGLLAWRTELNIKETPVKIADIEKFSMLENLSDSLMSTASINHIELHPNGRQLVVLCKDSAIRVVDLRMGSVIQTFTGLTCFKDRIRCTVTPCGTYIISGSEDCNAYAWNITSGKSAGDFSSLQYRFPVIDVDFHPYDNIVVFCAFGDHQPILIYSYDAILKDVKTDSILKNTQTMDNKAQDSTELSRSVSLTATTDIKALKQSMFDVAMSKLSLEKAKEKFQDPVKVIEPVLDRTAGVSPFPSKSSINETWGDSTFDKTYFPPSGNEYSNQTAQHLHPSEMNFGGQMQPQLSRLGSIVEGYDAIDRLRQRTSSAMSNELPDFKNIRRGSSVLEGSIIAGLSSFNAGTGTRRPSLIGGYGGYLDRQFSVHPDGNQPLLFGPSSSHSGTVATALYDYEASRSDELSVRQGDQIAVLYVENQWLMGMLPSGQQGYVPINYLATDRDILKNSSNADISEMGASASTQNQAINSNTEHLSAVISKTGELKIVSGPEDSDIERKRNQRRKVDNSEKGTRRKGSKSRKNLQQTH